MAFNSPNTDWDLSAQKVTAASARGAGSGQRAGENAQIQMSAAR
jgi:hypothetical protein